MKAPYRTWTAKERDLLRAWRAEGLGNAECARRLGRTAKQVYSFVARYDLPRHYTHLDDATRRRFARLYAKGWSDADIAEACGRAPSTVCVWRHAQGLPAHGHRSVRSRQKQRRVMAAADRAEGMPLCLRSRLDDMARAVSLGWAVPMARHERRLCEALLAGPLTTAELAARLGQTRVHVADVAHGLRLRGALESHRTGKTLTHRLASGVRRESA